jgi:hypothetical protein
MLKRKAVTLVELMIAVAIMSIGILGMVGAFKFFNVGIQSSKTRSLANNIAQERIEFLKNKSYYRVLVTTETVSPADANFSPAMVYDAYPNGSEVVNVGGIDFQRRVLIQKVNEDPSSGGLTPVSWTAADTGLKEIIVYVVWLERGEWRKLEVRNLRENPQRVNQSATVSGHAHDESTTLDLEDVVVRAQESPSQYGTTNSDGDYSFTIEPGTYTLLATKDGYFPRTLPSFGVVSGGSANNQNFGLVRMSSGSITGNVWMRDHLVISQIVGSSLTAYGSAEWVEVYNPTTWTWTMATGLGSDGGTGTNRKVIVMYTEAGVPPIETFPNIDYRATAVSPGAYFLFANTGTITAAGVTKAADAVYSTDWDFSDMDDMILTGTPSPAGHVIMGDVTIMQEYDLVGWNATDNGTSAKKNAGNYEGAAIVQTIGFQEGEEYVRKTVSGASAAWYGRCYDSGNNDYDMMDNVPIAHWPHNRYDSDPCISGTPAAGGIVFADDSLSSPATVASDGSFNLTNVSTGAWTVYASSGVTFSSVPCAGGASNGFVSSVGAISIASSTIYGYVTGRVANVGGTPLAGIKMYSPGSQQVATNSAGRYTLPVEAGIVTVTANYQTQTPSYVELSSMSVVVDLGQVVKDVDFSLYYGGKISGKVTTNGVDPLPNIPVVALKAGVEQGNGISDANGDFLISGASISTGTYVVSPQLEAGESASPSSSTVLVTAGATAYSANYVVSGAFGYVNGTVRTGSSAGPEITTGVLIYVTTATLAADAYPPDITSGLRSGTGVYYAVSSNARGAYSIPVKGGYTYNVYAWYTTWNNGTPYTVRKDATGVSVTPAQTVTRDFFW